MLCVCRRFSRRKRGVPLRKRKNQIFNLAGAKFVTINQVVENLRQIFGDIKVTYEPARPGDFRGVKINIEKAKKILGWEPRTSFREGLRKTIQHFKKKSPEM